MSLQVSTVKASVFVTAISFGIYLLARAGAALRRTRRASPRDTAHMPHADVPHAESPRQHTGYPAASTGHSPPVPTPPIALDG